jgi:hypothetical protein
MIGGHSQRDGGFTILPLTEQRSAQLAAAVRVNADVMGEWIAAAENLAHTLSLTAFGVNLMLTHELREAEERYDAAKTAAREILSTYLPTKG